jgi:hypothetical protein
VDQASLESVEYDVDRLVPKNLFKYPTSQGDENLSERVKVVKDFCFPNGVLVTKLNYNPDDESQNDPVVNDIITDILYKQKKDRECTFNFTLDANEEVGEAGDNYLNCMCITFNELMRR